MVVQVCELNRAVFQYFPDIFASQMLPIMMNSHSKFDGIEFGRFEFLILYRLQALDPETIVPRGVI